MPSPLESPQQESRAPSRRPALLRALGNNEPPEVLTIDGVLFRRATVFKHDSWAATAVYESANRKVVCKMNRESPVFFLPMGWLGRWLGQREFRFLQRLAHLHGIPRSYPVHDESGRAMRNACAHDYVSGEPLSLCEDVPEEFFDRLDSLLAGLHRNRVAYIDLHKQENVIVGEDGHPWLIDFQISAGLPDFPLLRSLFSILAESDRYHAAKHRHRRMGETSSRSTSRPPWWIRAHRLVAVPFRTARRRLLVILGVRKGAGNVSSEQAIEPGLRGRSKPLTRNVC